MGLKQRYHVRTNNIADYSVDFISFIICMKEKCFPFEVSWKYPTSMISERTSIVSFNFESETTIFKNLFLSSFAKLNEKFKIYTFYSLFTSLSYDNCDIFIHT